MTLLKSNQTLREKYPVAVQNKFEVFEEAEEVDQRWANFIAAITEAAEEQIQESIGKKIHGY